MKKKKAVLILHGTLCMFVSMYVCMYVCECLCVSDEA